MISFYGQLDVHLITLLCRLHVQIRIKFPKIVIHGVLFALSSLCMSIIQEEFRYLILRRIVHKQLKCCYLLQIVIPAVDTTYWCQGFLLPDEIRQQTRYITRVWSKILSICHLQVLCLLPRSFSLPSSLLLSLSRILGWHITVTTK